VGKIILTHKDTFKFNGIHIPGTIDINDQVTEYYFTKRSKYVGRTFVCLLRNPAVLPTNYSLFYFIVL
jgi:hypothetical protein